MYISELDEKPVFYLTETRFSLSLDPINPAKRE